MWLKLHTEKYLEQELERLDATNTTMVRSIHLLFVNLNLVLIRRDDIDVKRFCL
jgi:hypothetical protein